MEIRFGLAGFHEDSQNEMERIWCGMDFWSLMVRHMKGLKGACSEVRVPAEKCRQTLPNRRRKIENIGQKQRKTPQRTEKNFG